MFNSEMLTFTVGGIALGDIAPLIDGAVASADAPIVESDKLVWRVAGGRFVIELVAGEPMGLRCRIEGTGEPYASIGVRFGRIAGVERYLRNGYQSWDGSYFAKPGTPAGDGPPGQAPTVGFAMTALLPVSGEGVVVLGFTRHDRFQSHLRFGGNAAAMTLDIDTLLDRVPGAQAGEPMVLFAANSVEDGLRQWSQIIATESPLPPRLPAERITGWCSWYNHYAMIDEPTIQRELVGAAAFRDQRDVALEVFQIDDGFTPEMGDWLEVKPQFPHGMKPLLAEISARGFVPGLWIAPFMVGNRSKLYSAHPDWVVQDVAGGPLIQTHFYGEFRWHKRSEEYYILDVTHPQAAAYMAGVFRIWAQDWGAGYFKTDFMVFGSDHGPDRAVWHEAGVSRIAIWRRMAAIIREAIGDAIWLGCGCPLWASVGFVDAVRIGRDIGVSWEGDYSAESLLRDLATRNHANGILWQADPDCVLLRDSYHELSDDQIESLTRYAAASGGVLMTSDTLLELSPARASLFAGLLAAQPDICEFPTLGREPRGLIEYRIAGARFAFNLSPTVLAYEGSAIAPFATEPIA